MRKGMAVEGYINEDGTVRPLEHYDDTELRGKIQTNKDDIDNLKSKSTDLDDRVTYLEKHGGAEDPTKADKVEDAVEGNFAGLDDEGNLTDSGKNASDFAAKNHEHDGISRYGAEIFADFIDENNSMLVVGVKNNDDDDQVSITPSNMQNLRRALENPAAPAASGNKLITNGQVYTAITPIALSATKAEGGAVFPLKSIATDTAKLDSFLTAVAEGVLHPVIFAVDDQDTHNNAFAAGYAKWVDSTVQEEVELYVYVGAGIVFKANAQLGHSEPNTWANYWVVTNHSDSFAISSQS